MALTVRGLQHSYGERQVFRHLDLEIETGKFICITGPSGCGKTTLLRILAGLIKPQAGEVLVDGRSLNLRRGELGFVFQEDALFPWLTVKENVEFGLRIQGWPKGKRERVVDEYLSMVGLSPVAHYFPSQLSGGMKQRVALVRALAYNPRIVLMDEPFASLDCQTRNRLQLELIQLWQREAKTVIFVTHNIDEAVFLADQVIVLGGYPTSILARIEVPFTRPRTRTSPEFVGLRERILGLLENAF